MLSLIAAVGWWWWVAHNDKEEKPFLYALLDDLSWTVGAILRLVKGEKGKKRLAADDSDRAAKKLKP